MSKQRNLKPLAIAVGAALTAGMMAISVVNLEENPFGMTQLSSGYMVADKGEGKCGEGKCGEGKEEKKGEGKCGGK
jgi:uncharacterized low-complexity protein